MNNLKHKYQTLKRKITHEKSPLYRVKLTKQFKKVRKNLYKVSSDCHHNQKITKKNIKIFHKINNNEKLRVKRSWVFQYNKAKKIHSQLIDNRIIKYNSQLIKCKQVTQKRNRQWELYIKVQQRNNRQKIKHSSPKNRRAIKKILKKQLKSDRNRLKKGLQRLKKL